MSKIIDPQPGTRDTMGSDTFSGDFALLMQAIADAFRGLSPSAPVESRWSRLRACDRAFGSGC